MVADALRDRHVQGAGLLAPLELGDAMSALKLTVPGDAPIVNREELDQLLAGGPVRLQ